MFGKVAEREVRRMSSALVSRGPDDEGVWSDTGVSATLGHRRLSILDLSPAGHQPMSYLNGRLWVSFSGEIYNFRELRAQLEGQGFVFRSQSDTEVVLAAYAAWGPDCLAQLRGMFAFALVDRAPPKHGDPAFFLARDRFGIKPVVYLQVGSELWFASELRGLLASGQLSSDIDKEALLDFLAVGAVSQPRTIFSQAKALPPGTYLTFGGGKIQLHRYWDLHEATRELASDLRNISFGDAAAELRLRLEEATRYHLVSDLPVGAFLSGGVDSTAVVGLMSQVSQAPVKTISVGFSSGSTVDERGFARLAARTLGTDHRELVVGANEIALCFPEVVQALDQPSVDGTNTWLVSRAARSEVTVAISGLGGDEIFAGYSHFNWLQEAAGKPGRRDGVRRRLLERAQRIRPTTIAFKQLLALATPAERLSMLRRLLPSWELSRAVKDNWSHDHRSRLTSRHSSASRYGADPIQQASIGEVSGYLLSTLLRDCDSMSMAHALEVRPVLLDHRVAEFGYALPPEHKILGEMRKRVLVASVEDVLPSAIVKRKKVGFELPFVDWMTGPLRTRLLHLLSTPVAQGLFKDDYLASLRSGLSRGSPPRALWAWGVLLEWFEQNGLVLPT